MAITGFVQRIKGKSRAHVIYLGSGGIQDAFGNQLLGGTPNDALTAHAGGTRAAALQLKYGWNRLSVVATANDSVALPAAAKGTGLLIVNDGVATAKVFAMVGTSDTIDGIAAATGVSLTNAKRSQFFCFTAGAWVSMTGGVTV